MGRLFGTDGARGVAITELTCELLLYTDEPELPQWCSQRETNHKAKIIMAKDTAVSQATFWSPHWWLVSAQLVQTLTYSVLFLPLPLQCL